MSIEGLDRLPGYYDTGLATVTKGSTTVFGQGVNWTGVVYPNDYFWALDGTSVRIAEVNGETLTLAFAFMGESQEGAPYEIRFADSATRISETTRRLINLLSKGAFFREDASGNLAGRVDYDARPLGFAYLDTSVNPMQLYKKLSDASGDWSDGVNYMQGEQGGNSTVPGPPGSPLNAAGAWSAAIVYSVSDVVSWGGRIFASIQGANQGHQPPGADSDDAWWMFIPVVSNGVQSSNSSVTDIVALTQAEYDLLSPPNGTTIYWVTD